MNRTAAVAIVVVALLSGTVATAAAFADGDEVAPGSEVYLDAADSENGEQYVRIDGNDEVRIQFDTLLPGSQTRIDDLFVVGFAGYEDSNASATVRLKSTDGRVTLKRMDTGETLGERTIELQPGESVLFGAVVSTNTGGFSSTIELEVEVPDTNAGDGSGSDGGSGTDGDGGGGTDGDDTGDGEGSDTGEDGTDDGGDSGGGEPADRDGDMSNGPTESGQDAEGGTDDAGDGVETGDDALDPTADTDADPRIDLIELAGFGSPLSLIVVSILGAILSLSYIYRLRSDIGDLTGNAEGSER
jgi:hypothetical protein